MRQLDFEYLETVFTGDSADDLYVISSPVQSVLVVDEEARVVAIKRAQASHQGYTLTFSTG